MLELLKKPARFTLNKALQLKTKLAIRHLKDKSIILLEIGAGEKKAQMDGQRLIQLGAQTYSGT